MDSKTRHVTNNSKSRKHILSIALIETHALACGRFASSQSVLIINKLVALSLLLLRVTNGATMRKRQKHKAEVTRKFLFRSSKHVQ